MLDRSPFALLAWLAGGVGPGRIKGWSSATRDPGWPFLAMKGLRTGAQGPWPWLMLGTLLVALPILMRQNGRRRRGVLHTP